MRRKDREICKQEEIVAIIKKCKVCRIAMMDGIRPYIVPLNFGYDYGDGKVQLYFHSAVKGRKIDILSNNGYVCFEMDCGHHLVESEKPCEYGYKFESVIGEGHAELLDNVSEKQRALSMILQHQCGKTYDIKENETKSVAVIKIEVTEMCGKIRP